VVHIEWALAGMYVAGVALGLLMSDEQPAQRFVLAVLWPLGPLAFVMTVSILLVAAVIAFPLVMVPALGVAALAWRLLS
jgi:hypothetical protein